MKLTNDGRLLYELKKKKKKETEESNAGTQLTMEYVRLYY